MLETWIRTFCESLVDNVRFGRVDSNFSKIPGISFLEVWILTFCYERARIYVPNFCCDVGFCVFRFLLDLLSMVNYLFRGSLCNGRLQSHLAVGRWACEFTFQLLAVTLGFAFSIFVFFCVVRCPTGELGRDFRFAVPWAFANPTWLLRTELANFPHVNNAQGFANISHVNLQQSFFC